MLYKEENNKGLAYNFRLLEGSFELTGGTEKVERNTYMWLSFLGWFRVYYEDFVPGVLTLLQRPASSIESSKILILGRLQDSVRKYLPEIDVQQLNLERTADRKNYVLGLKYRYNLERETDLFAITFITI